MPPEVGGSFFLCFFCFTKRQKNRIIKERKEEN